MAQPQTARRTPSVTAGTRNSTAGTSTPVDKKAKFIELGTKRTNKVIKGLKHIGNLSTYEYTEEQVTKMFDVLTASLDGARARFQAGGTKTDEGFKF